MPLPANILLDLQPLFRQILKLPELNLTEDMPVRGVDEWDSLNHVRLITATEQKFNIRLSSVEVEQMNTLGDWAKLVAQKLPQ